MVSVGPDVRKKIRADSLPVTFELLSPTKLPHAFLPRHAPSALVQLEDLKLPMILVPLPELARSKHERGVGAEPRAEVVNEATQTRAVPGELWVGVAELRCRRTLLG